MDMLPRTIDVGPFRYLIRQDPSADGESRFGETDKLNQVITIAVLCKPERVPVTFIHEVMHAVWAAYGLAGLDADEERIVTALANGLAQVLMDVGYLPRALAIEE